MLFKENDEVVLKGRPKKVYRVLGYANELGNTVPVGVKPKVVLIEVDSANTGLPPGLAEADEENLVRIDVMNTKLWKVLS